MKHKSHIAAITALAAAFVAVALLASCTPAQDGTEGTPSTDSRPVTAPGGAHSMSWIEEHVYGDRNVNLIREGDIDEDACLVIGAVCDRPDLDDEDAVFTITVTSDTTVPYVTGTDPLEASFRLWAAGLDAEPYFTSYSRPRDLKPGDPNPEVTATGTSVPAGTAVRVGTTVEVSYSGPTDAYS